MKVYRLYFWGCNEKSTSEEVLKVFIEASAVADVNC